MVAQALAWGGFNAGPSHPMAGNARSKLLLPGESARCAPMASPGAHPLDFL